MIHHRPRPGAGSSRRSAKRIGLAVGASAAAAALVAGAASAGATPATANASKHAKSAKHSSYVKLPKLTIGYLRFIASDPSDQADYNAIKTAASALGWKVIPCDGQGNPTVMIACGHTLLSDNINAFIDDGIPQSLIAPILSQAKAKGIPRLTFSGTLYTHNLYSGTYTAPDEQMGYILGKWIAAKLEKLPKAQRQMIVQQYPADWGNARVIGLHKALAGTGIKIAATPTADPTNLVQGTQDQISTLLNGNLNVRAVWVTFDAAGTGAATAVHQKFLGKKFPNAPLVTTFYQAPATISMIKSGQLSATVYESLGWDAFVTIDMLAQYEAKHQPFPQTAQPSYGPKNIFWQPRVIDSSNVNKPLTPPVNYVKYFANKWHKEFGVNTSGMAKQLNPLP